MDWTGGTRRRFAPGRNNANLQKQKAHFAKARAALHGTPSTHRGSISSLLPARSPALRSRVVNRSPASQVIGGSGRDDRGDLEHVIALNVDDLGSREPSCGNDIDDLVVATHSAKAVALVGPQLHNQHRQPRHFRSNLLPVISDEERLLLARRRHLLDRPNWLGLSTFHRPRVSSSPLRDKQLVGRRRRVKQATGRAEDRSGRRLLPATHDLGITEPISSTFGGEDIQIKIGTDALATQTQRSVPSLNSRQTSMRRLSTDMSLLSEESMLLDATDVILDRDTVHNTGPDQTNIIVPRSDDDILSLHDRPELWHQHVPGYPLMGQYEHDDPSHSRETQGQISTQRVQEPKMTVLGANTLVPTMITSDIVNDEQLWKHFINVNPSLSSSKSIAAVKSSSLRDTDSDRPGRLSPSMIGNFDHMQNIQEILSTPQGAGTQGSLLRGPREEVDEAITTPRASSLPSGSLQRLTMMAQQDLPLQKQDEDRHHEDNELWRAFVVGSRSNSVASSPRLDTATGDKSNLEDVEVSTAPVLALSTFVSSLETSHFSAVERTEDVAIRTETMFDPLYHLEAQPAERDESNNNIHVAAANSKRRRLGRAQPALSKQDKSSSSPDQRRGAKRQRPIARSIYDLVDSDGQSLA